MAREGLDEAMIIADGDCRFCRRPDCAQLATHYLVASLGKLSEFTVLAQTGGQRRKCAQLAAKLTVILRKTLVYSELQALLSWYCNFKKLRELVVSW